MERLTKRERNSNGTAISKKSMIDREEAIKDLDIIRFNPHWDELVNEEY